MSEQLSLAGFDAEPRPTDGVFFAIRPDMDAAKDGVQRAWHLRDALGLKGKPLAMERLHVTLIPLGEYEGLPRGIVAAACDAAATVAMPRFDVAFDRAMSFSGRPGNLPFVLCGDDGVAGLLMLQRLLGTALQKAGLGRRVETQYTPHMTLLYDGRPVAGQAVEVVGWTACEFVLIHSLLGRKLHIPLARWPLRG